MKRALVTGATGFVGRAVVPLLQERGFEVHVLGRSPPRDQQVTFYAANLLSPIEVSAVIATVRPSHLLHLAWYAEPGLYWKSPSNLDWAAASIHLVRTFAEAGGQRVVVAGTCAEYEWGGLQFHETQTACIPATLYGATKDGLHRILGAYAAVVGISLAWGRIFYIYGPDEKSGRLVSDAIQRLLAGEQFPTSDGRQKRDFLHISDVAAAFAAILDGSVEGPINIGSGRAVPVRDMLQLIAAEIGRPDLLGFGDKPMPLNEPPTIEADTRRLREEVGFNPRCDLKLGLSNTVAWWRTLGRSAKAERASSKPWKS